MTKKTDISLKTDSDKDSTITITATVPSEHVAKHLEDSLRHLGHDLTIKGFRKGKAPLNKIKENVDNQKLTNHTLEHIFPEVLKAIFNERKLKVIGNHVLKAATTPDNADWTITLALPLLPEFETKRYKTKIKAALKSAPKKDKKDEKTNPEGEKLSIVLDTLLKEIKLTVPESLITQEVNQSLVRLFDHTQSLGITVDQYLKSLGKDTEQIKKEYQQAAEDNLKIEFILDRIATDLKIEVPEDEITGMINASGDQAAKDQLNNPEQRAYVKGILRKRKTIDALLNL